MARRYFGTDGVRGVYGEDLTDTLVRRLGFAFAAWSRQSSVLIARDTRASGETLCLALADGLASGKAQPILAGVLPTPAVPLLAEGCGAVVSASHNPPEYNGVKFFDVRGRKLSDEAEEDIEALLDGRLANGAGWSVTYSQAGGLAQAYVDVVCERFGLPLGGLRVAVDCANGAMYEVAPAALQRLGASVTPLANEPNGVNINAGCGATDLSLLSRTVREGEFDLGVAFDGDGDRMLAVDAAGNEVDGDQILAVLALHLDVDLVAVTQMTNLGFHRLMAERGIRVVTTDVGDRYVLEALLREGGTFGGEQSGHLIYLEGHTTGDGLVAALLLCRAVVESGKSLAELVAVMPRFPQAKANVPVRVLELPATVLERIAELNDGLGDSGRILVRPSGTEPVIRVLAEAENPADAAALCARIEHLVRLELG